MTQEEFSRKHLSHLNPQQKTAIQSVDGATLLLAVPGSGKTTVLVTRLGYMVYCREIPPQSILTMTYTVAATEEMKNRFAQMFGAEYAEDLEFRTINGLSAKVIDYYSRNHGRGKPFQLLADGADATRLVGQIYQRVTGEFATQSVARDVSTAITYVKNMMLIDEEIKALDIGVSKFPEIYEEYCGALRRGRLMDYDDQMKYALDILEKRPEVLDYFQKRYRYLCVDESQDTSKIQHAIIQLLAGEHGNLFMVGDEDQSIYGFRAAYPDALMNFKQEYHEAQVLLIEQNYRSTEPIVAAANAFVSKNRFRHAKAIVPTRTGGAPVEIIEAVDRQAQYKYLFQVAKACRTETAVLFRNNDSALPLIDLLDQSNLPYRCRQFEGSFFTHPVVNDLTDIINFAYDPFDGDAFMRIYYKFGSPLSKKAASYACTQSRITGRTILEELLSYPELSGYAKEGVSDLSALLPMVTKGTGAQAVQQIKLSGYGYYVDTKNLDAGKLDILLMLGKSQESARDLLNRLVELQDIIGRQDRAGASPFILSTIHSSKGLEYEAVYLLDVLDGILPAKPLAKVSSPEEAREYEEARRLFYVGMTRAKNHLHLFRAPSVESSFIREVADSLPVEQTDPEGLFAAFAADLCGKAYTHRERGEGRVIAQKGLSLLVEYEDGGLDLNPVFRLYEERKVIRTNKVPLKQELKKKTGQTKSSRKTAEAEDPQVLASKLACGRTAHHTKYGEGVIEQNDGTTVSIRFRGSGKVKKFAIKFAAEQGLIKAVH